MNKSPVSILYGVNGGGYAEVSARAGTAVPANHPSLPILGSDGTSFRHLFTDSSGRLFISAASLPLPTGAATETTLLGVLTTVAFQARINTLGQKAMAASTPVVLASDQSVIPVSDNGSSLTVDGTVAATQSGSWTVASTQSGAWTVASTQSGVWSVAVNNFPATQAVTQSGLWNVGQTGIWTVQPGNTQNTTPWLTRTSDGTNHVNIKAASTAALAADTSLVVGLSPNSPLPTGSNIIGALTANQSVNLNQVAGTLINTGNGLAGLGSQRVTIASDNTPFTVNASQFGSWTVLQGGSPWGFDIQYINGFPIDSGNGSTGSGTQRVTIASDNTPFGVAQSGIWTVQPGNTPNTVPWLIEINDGFSSVAIAGPSTPAAMADPALVVGLSPNSPLPTGSNIIGALTANQTVNLTQLGSNPVSVSNGLVDLGTQRVAIASDNTPFTVNATQSGAWTVAVNNFPAVQPVSDNGSSLTVDGTVNAVQSGTWTVQPGNTQNTTPWLTRISDGTNHVNVKAASTAAVAADPSVVTAFSPNSPLPVGTNVVGALVANQTVNMAQVGGTNTVSGGVAGSQGVGGLAATGAALAGNPVLVAGSDGTNARTIKADATGQQYVRPTQPITFTVFTAAVTPGNGKSMVSIHNNSAFIVKIWKIVMVNAQTAAVAGVVTTFETRRFTSHSGGTSITPSTNDSADTVDAGITAATGATLVGESSTAGRRAQYSSDEWTGGGAAASTESLQQIGQQLHPWLNYGDMPWIKPPTLRPGEGVNVKCVTNTAVGSWDFHIICTQEPA